AFRAHGFCSGRGARRDGLRHRLDLISLAGYAAYFPIMARPLGAAQRSAQPAHHDQLQC
ncbi:unnamed protein product, partial [Symbiodinium microadriaticum]